MTIYDDIGAVVEKVPLHEIKSNKALHSLMVEKGFRLRPMEEQERIKAEHREAERKRIANKPRNDKIKLALLMAILLLILLACYYCCCRPCWRRFRQRSAPRKTKD